MGGIEYHIIRYEENKKKYLFDIIKRNLIRYIKINKSFNPKIRKNG